MFDLVEVEQETLQLVISLPDLESVPNGTFISVDQITSALQLEESVDALFVSALTPEQQQELSRICENKAIELIVFAHPANDQAVIKDVVLNLADKFFSDEMPANIGITDIRNLNLCSDSLFAFTTKQSALAFMTTQPLGAVTGGVFLAHGDTSLSEYESINEELLAYFLDESFLCSSFHTAGRSECTILLGIRK